VGAAPHREGVRFQRRGRRLHPDPAVHLPVRSLLVGLVLNATLGWSWAGPIAGLVIAAVAVKEGREAWRGENCGCGPVDADQGDDDGDACGCSDGDCTDGCCTPAARNAAEGPRG
jgi:hypothetical protein